VKTNKNDYIDAEAIAEAVGRPTMRFVPIKASNRHDGLGSRRLQPDSETNQTNSRDRCR
jgi:transposase